MYFLVLVGFLFNPERFELAYKPVDLEDLVPPNNFSCGLQASRGADRWVNEFTTGEGKHRSVDDKWVDEFSNLHIDEEWADEFGKQVGEGAADSWANAYDE